METSDKENSAAFEIGDSVVTGITRHANAIKEKISELFDKLFSFVSLIIMTSVEACFLFVFVRVHEQTHLYLHHKPWCPLTIALSLMVFSFLLLNLVIVLAYVATEISTTIKSLRSSLRKKGRETQTSPTPSHGREASAHSFTIGGTGSARVMITTTVVDEPDLAGISSARLRLSKV